MNLGQSMSELTVAQPDEINYFGQFLGLQSSFCFGSKSVSKNQLTKVIYLLRFERHLSPQPFCASSSGGVMGEALCDSLVSTKFKLIAQRHLDPTPTPTLYIFLDGVFLYPSHPVNL